MAVKKVEVAPRRRDDVLRRRDEPPLGSLQAKILKQIAELDDEAYAYRVLGVLMREADGYIDPAQVYTSLKKMTGRQYVRKIGVRHDTRGPEQKIYGLTAAGAEALRLTQVYHEALGKYLKRGK